MSDPYLGEVRFVGFNFAPVGWALCQGQAVSVSQNQALYALLGTFFGGNQTAFNLPDLQGRSPVGTGAGVGLTPIAIGDEGGAESVSLTINQLPAHNHVAQTSGGVSGTVTVAIPATTTTSAEGGTPGPTTVLGPLSLSGRAGDLYSTSAPTTTLAPFNAQFQSSGGGSVQIGVTGNSMPTPLRNPYLGMTAIIALEGIYPTRG